MKLRRQKVIIVLVGRKKSYGHKGDFETVLRGVIPVALLKLLRKKKASDFFRSDLIFFRF